MSIDIRYCSDSQVVSSAQFFTVNFSLVNDGDALKYIICNNDLLMLYFREQLRFFARNGTKSIGEMFGFSGYGRTLERLIVSFKPSSIPPQDSYDDRWYGSIFRNLQVFGATLGMGTFSIPSTKGEHFCRHATYSGELVPERAEVPMFLEPLDFWGYSLMVKNTHHIGYRTVTVNTTGPLSVTARGDGDWSLGLYDVDDLLRYLTGKEIINIMLNWNSDTWIRKLSDLSYSLDSTKLSIRYLMTVDVPDDGSGAQHYVWASRFEVIFGSPPPTVQPVAGNVYEATPAGSFNWNYDVLTASPWTGAMQASPSLGNPDSGYRPWACMLSLPEANYLVEEARSISIHAGFSQHRFLESFKKSVETAWPDIVPSSLFSSVDAFKEAEGYLGMNILQNLAKIPGLVSALPQVREAIDVLGRIAKRDFSLATLRSILDLATSTTLQANFQWRPYSTIITSYLPDMISTMHSLGDIKENAIGRGSFTFKLTNQLGRESVTLTTRTKIVMDASPSGLLSAVLGIDALGALPKASNVWDLLPFSFVANWFTGVGEAMRRAEYSLLLATIPAYFVHTYTLSSPLSAHELDLIEASSSSAEPASLRVYYRDISLHSPYPRDSKFGFGMPSELPFAGVLGSLLYQLIFG